RTSVITSSHRTFAVTEKIGPGNDIADSAVVAEALGVSAHQVVAFDMNVLAVRHGSVISAALFGALAATGKLPFAHQDFLDVIEKSGKGAEASAQTFDAAYRQVMQGPEAKSLYRQQPKVPHVGPVVTILDGELVQCLPEPSHEMARTGLIKVLDFQGLAYGRKYLRRLAEIAALDCELGGETKGYELTRTAAKHLANAMAYDDVIRVADLKTRSARRARVEREAEVASNQILHTTEYMHPRGEELVGLLPAGFARWVHDKPGIYSWINRRVSKGRRIKTYSIISFLALFMLGGMRGVRLRSLRHAQEWQHITHWLDCALGAARSDYALAIQILRMRRLVKGYSDTHARSQSKFDKALRATGLLAGRDGAADWAKRLTEAALRDPDGESLDGLIKTMESVFT
ncbi:MAG: indolepyruvate oxidoreductase subunit beta family protein, partial [Pontixanthobacter sp.]